MIKYLINMNFYLLYEGLMVYFKYGNYFLKGVE